MPRDAHAGYKYLWVGRNGVLEMHGEEKKSWTWLDDHLCANSVCAVGLEWQQSKDTVIAKDTLDFIDPRLGKKICLTECKK